MEHWLTKVLRQHTLWLYREESAYALHANLWRAKNIFIQTAGEYRIIYCNELIGLGCMWHTLDEWLQMDISEVHKYDKNIHAKWFVDLQCELPGLVRLAELWFELDRR